MTGRPSGRRTHICPPDHKHGATSTCYNTHGCGCAQCRDGMAASEARRAKLKAYNRYDNGFEDATPAREHLQALVDFGIPLGRISRMVGKDYRWLEVLLRGRDGTHLARISHANAALILGLELDATLRARTGMVNARGAVRRLQALQTLGWTFARLQRECGVTVPQYFDRTVRHAAEITVENDRIIRALYSRLWNQTPSFRNGRDRDAGARAAARAARLGWVGPLGWGDIDQDDDPEVLDVVPVVDSFAVELTCEGRRPRKLSMSERDAAITWLNGHRFSDPIIAARVGVTARTVWRRRMVLGLPGWSKEEQLHNLEKESA